MSCCNQRNTCIGCNQNNNNGCCNCGCRCANPFVNTCWSNPCFSRVSTNIDDTFV